MQYLLESRKSSFDGLGCLGASTFHFFLIISFLLDRVKPVHAQMHCIPVAKRDRAKKKLDEAVVAGKWAETG